MPTGCARYATNARGKAWHSFSSNGVALGRRQEDGLWTTANGAIPGQPKQPVLGAYLRARFPILSRGRNFDRIIYIDGFAGSGRGIQAGRGRLAHRGAESRLGCDGQPP